MIDSDQLRAARALLDWKTADLAALSGVTVNAINNIERKVAQGRRETLEKIQKVFEDAGLEFLPGSGVRKKDRIVETFDGGDAEECLLDDVYETLVATGGEVLIAHVDEDLAIKTLSQEYLSKHLERLRAANIRERMLICAGNKTLVTDLDSYRMIPEEFFIPTPMFIYGRKLALLSQKPAPRVVIVDDPRFAESARRLFNFAWKNAQRLPLSMKKVDK